ncbi:MAG: 4Fe-4S dicluster domain-containing protein, partial [Eggerthella lenta]
MTRYGMAIDLRRCAGCGACVVACQMQNNQRPGVSWNNLDVYEWGTQAGESGRAYVPNACVQCEKPACVDACPTGASVRRDDGITVIDYEKCIACGLCLAACPYGARKLNRTSENMFGADVPAPYESYGVQRELVAEKCIFCEARLAEGKQPACVVNCPGRA